MRSGRILRRMATTAAVGIVAVCPGTNAGARTGAQVEVDSTPRAQGWALVTELARVTGAQHTSEAPRWHSVDAVFSVHSPLPAPTPFPARADADKGADAALRSTERQSGEPEIVIETYYNDVAYRHVRSQRLHERATLERLRRTGDPDPRFAGNRRIPPFPAGSMIVLAAWWPVAGDAPTPLPVWDPDDNLPRRGGNHYLTWKRIVALSAPSRSPGLAGSATDPTTQVEFAGRAVPDARRISLDRFLQVDLDAAWTARAMRDPRLRRAAIFALRRPLAAGDRLVLVAAHVIGKPDGEWRWATLWWHDRPDQGPFARDRPATLSGAWRQYLVDVAQDPLTTPADGSMAPASFNPWLEARFPDGGAGGGMSSHCIVCHRRASYPAARFLPVTRGGPDVSSDAAFSPGRLRTDFVWGIARRPDDRSPEAASASNQGAARTAGTAKSTTTRELLIERLR